MKCPLGCQSLFSSHREVMQHSKAKHMSVGNRFPCLVCLQAKVNTKITTVSKTNVTHHVKAQIHEKAKSIIERHFNWNDTQPHPVSIDNVEAINTENINDDVVMNENISTSHEENVNDNLIDTFTLNLKKAEVHEVITNDEAYPGRNITDLA